MMGFSACYCRHRFERVPARTAVGMICFPAMCSRLNPMRKSKVNIRRSAQNAGSPIVAYVVVLLFFVCFLIFLWVIVVGTRFLVG